MLVPAGCHPWPAVTVMQLHCARGSAVLEEVIGRADETGRGGTEDPAQRLLLGGKTRGNCWSPALVACGSCPHIASPNSCPRLPSPPSLACLPDTSFPKIT